MSMGEQGAAYICMERIEGVMNTRIYFIVYENLSRAFMYAREWNYIALNFIVRIMLPLCDFISRAASLQLCHKHRGLVSLFFVAKMGVQAH